MFEIKDKFYLNGEPFQIISGAFHYFRTVPEYWRDRLEKLKNMGCNTVETYIPWNFHEPEKGKFLWDGMHNICRFIETAQDLGLYLILRPSPYICAEWEFGGLPAWLLKEPKMRLRCSYKPYLNAVEEYYRELLPKIAPYQIDCGGNVLLLQVENEYGYYGDDTAYLEFLRDTMKKYGITVPFVTSDGPWGKAFEAGKVSQALQTGNFGSDVLGQFELMKKKIGEESPLMCMEFWVGWFDEWGGEHHRSDLKQNKKDLSDLMQYGNVNFYMFEGGTNFGFMNGRNGDSKTADVTSYDYDGILTEDGQITEKYYAFQKIISQYRKVPQISLSTDIKRKEYGEILLKAKTDLFSVLEQIATPLHSLYPISMEEAGQNTGYILYRTKIKESECVDNIQLEGAEDRVLGYQNGSYVFTAFAENLGQKFELTDKSYGAVIDLLVENMGRVNFGTGLESQRKGIRESVRINDHRHFGYEIYTLPFNKEQISKIDFSSGYREGIPAFYEFSFNIEELADTFLDFTGFGKGCAFINGFNLGRYWEVGPQKRLYIPAPLMKKGTNQIILFETEGKCVDRIYLSEVQESVK